MAYTLNENLKRWAEQYETADFINADPVQIPHRYDSRVNIEISAFVTAWIAWGNRKQIIKKADLSTGKFSRANRIITLSAIRLSGGTAPNGSNTKGVPIVCTGRLRLAIFTTFAPVCMMFTRRRKTWRRQ